MRLVPTLWLGPRRLVRRPVETVLLVLAVALGTLGAATAAETLGRMVSDLARLAADPRLRVVRVWNQDSAKETAVRSDAYFQQMLGRVSFEGHFEPWVDRVRPQVGATAAFYSYTTAAAARTTGDWDHDLRSFCVAPSSFPWDEVTFRAGRPLTEAEFRRGDPAVVVGTHWLARLFPGVSPADALGREFDLRPWFWDEEAYRARIVGVVEAPGGLVTEVLSDPADGLWIAFRPALITGTAVFVAPSADQVPALTAQLRTLLDADPALKVMGIDSQYSDYQQTRDLAVVAALGTLGVGGGTLVIALWTLGSVFRSRLPGLGRSLRQLRGLGADRRTLAFLWLSEVLPGALLGLGLGFGAALGLRSLWGAGALPGWYPALVLALVGGAVGFLALTGARPPHRSRPGLRLGFAVAFLTLGLAGSYAALSLALDLGQTLPRLGQSLPIWAGYTGAQGQGDHYLRLPSSLGSADLAVLDRLVDPDQGTPIRVVQGQLENVRIEVPDRNHERFWIRTKVHARPALASVFGLGLVAGRWPVAEGSGPRPQALVTEEVAEALFGSAQAALGRPLRDLEAQAPALEAEYEIVGVMTNPVAGQEFLGAPDLWLVPDRRIESVLASTDLGGEYPALWAFVPGSEPFLAATVIPALEARSGEAPVWESWTGGHRTTVDPRWTQEMAGALGTNLTVLVLLASLFLVVSCLSVLSVLFVTITGRARQTAVERALGRPFGFYLRRSFAQGAGLVFAASVGALFLAWAALPTLAAGLAPLLGNLFHRSTGVVDLGWPAIVGVTLGAAVLAGLVATLPLWPYRSIPLSAQIQEAP